MNVFKKFVVLVLVVMGVIGLVSCKPEITKNVVEFVNTEFSNDKVEDGSKLLRLSDPLKDGYVFDDWYEDEEYQVLFDFSKPLKENTKIYANFYISIKKLLEVGVELSHGEVSEDKYMVKGKIKTINQMEYGNMIISDGNDEISVYGVYGSNNEKYSELIQKPVVGDIVVLRGPLKKFNEEIELNKTVLIKYEKGEPNSNIDLDEYEELTILDARTKKIDHKVIVNGVVAQITYANGKKTNGVYLVDNTNAIYLYDNNIASTVKVGDTIKVAGIRTNFILEDEKNQASRHGYEGAIQLADIVLLEKKELNSSFDETWIQQKTIKELMETNPRIENITGSIYRANAYIKKVPGTGFVNYYFNDLDDKTGSYTYSMNNGSDFTWLDEYDGQLRTVYLSVINAKSTASGIQYRFIPIKIGDLFEYDSKYNPIYAVKYYGVDQFEKSIIIHFHQIKN
ncbi:InlB B-repeat-containing protein [Haploplasma axanthum]|uniref:Listeria-Bacteroides repeat domain (List_Bact_rpt) n=1 Tax=Haploplasma axanthum TaxID=29552 RepID=A0A449BBR4_HAPAX|nr:InlB B-repeat-containing protein [Haploplasma axanthum]VEU79878.1 Listeria-Bacteroides repeat domain (List_Bact_rpt) [Haploplasma axanthum]